MDLDYLINATCSAVANMRAEKFTGKLTLQINFHHGGIAGASILEESGSGRKGETIVRRKEINGNGKKIT